LCRYARQEVVARDEVSSWSGGLGLLSSDVAGVRPSVERARRGGEGERERERRGLRREAEAARE
jgi:hypothetical protein